MITGTEDSMSFLSKSVIWQRPASFGSHICVTFDMSMIKDIMDSKTYFSMDIEQPNEWIQLIRWGLAWVTGTAGTVWTVNQFINRYFDFKVKQQAKFIEEVVDRKVTPEITQLKDAIDDLREAIWALKK